jgi:predicted phage tail protein
MKKVVLRGELGKQFGRVHHFDLNTPAEAIRALCANFEGFQQALVTAAERGVGYIVQVGKLAIEELDEIHNPTGQSEEISITPVLAGAGGGTGKILAGVALVAFAILAAPIGGGFLGLGAGAFGSTTGAALGGFTLGAAASSAVGFIGVSMILAGTAQLLSPQPADLPGLTGATGARGNSFDPANNDPADNRSSYIYNGAVNLTAQGNPVPICYGRMRVGSVVVSAGVSTTDI